MNCTPIVRHGKNLSINWRCSFFMAKFTAIQKLEAVNRAITGNESYVAIAHSLGVDDSSIHKWVQQYEHRGVEAFVKKYTNYSTQYKLDVLNYMIENGTSLYETAAIFKIPSPSTIYQWKQLLEKQGVNALQSKTKGRPSMKNELNTKVKKELVPGSIEALQAEIEQLRMENDYLKKLNALVQNKEKLQNKIKH